jgi:hypothetical protein
MLIIRNLAVLDCILCNISVCHNIHTAGWILSKITNLSICSALFVWRIICLSGDEQRSATDHNASFSQKTVSVDTLAHTGVSQLKISL